MEKKIRIILFLLSALVFVGCFDSKENDKDSTGNLSAIPEKTFPCIEGSITLGPEVNHNSLKIGLFYRTVIEGNSSIKIELDGLKGRLYYIDRDNPSHAVEISPDREGYIIGNQRNRYFINLPDPPVAQTAGEYYLTAWYDSDGDGKLDLMTEDIPAICETELSETNDPDCKDVVLEHTNEGEYNRVPVKNMVVTSKEGGYTNEATDVYLGYLRNDKNDNYQFKYYGVINFFDDQDEKALTGDNNDGFNFTIEKTIDSN